MNNIVICDVLNENVIDKAITAAIITKVYDYRRNIVIPHCGIVWVRGTKVQLIKYYLHSLFVFDRHKFRNAWKRLKKIVEITNM